MPALTTVELNFYNHLPFAIELALDRLTVTIDCILFLRSVAGGHGEITFSAPAGEGPQVWIRFYFHPAIFARIKMRNILSKLTVGGVTTFVR